MGSFVRHHDESTCFPLVHHRLFLYLPDNLIAVQEIPVYSLGSGNTGDFLVANIKKLCIEVIVLPVGVKQAMQPDRRLLHDPIAKKVVVPVIFRLFKHAINTILHVSLGNICPDSRITIIKGQVRNGGITGV